MDFFLGRVDGLDVTRVGPNKKRIEMVRYPKRSSSHRNSREIDVYHHGYASPGRHRSPSFEDDFLTYPHFGGQGNRHRHHSFDAVSMSPSSSISSHSSRSPYYNQQYGPSAYPGARYLGGPSHHRGFHNNNYFDDDAQWAHTTPRRLMVDDIDVYQPSGGGIGRRNSFNGGGRSPYIRSGSRHRGNHIDNDLDDADWDNIPVPPMSPAIHLNRGNGGNTPRIIGGSHHGRGNRFNEFNDFNDDDRFDDLVEEDRHYNVGGRRGSRGYHR